MNSPATLNNNSLDVKPRVKLVWDNSTNTFNSLQTSARPSIINSVASAIERYVFLPDQRLYRFLATCAIGTYLVASSKESCFDFYGYLLADSPTPACGKTQLLRVMDKLVWSSSGIITDP